MRINSRHALAEHRNDLYETPYEAIASLIQLEDLPKVIWEPAAGRGAIVRPLETAGHTVIATDLIDYGCGYTGRRDYLLEPVPDCVDAVVTNPPYILAQDFIRKAIGEVPYSAWLLRLNFVESVGRFQFFQETPPARIWVSSRRMPFMHRDGWDGPISSSNQCFAWFVFVRGVMQTTMRWFDYAELVKEKVNA